MFSPYPAFELPPHDEAGVLLVLRGYPVSDRRVLARHTKIAPDPALGKQEEVAEENGFEDIERQREIGIERYQDDVRSSSSHTPRSRTAS